MELPQYLRLFPMRAPKLMWLLGAGCSVSSGIPTAGDMIWDFKRLIYCSENRAPIQSVPQLTDPSFREKLAAYFASKGGFPPDGHNEEYAFYFEQTYPDERERRKYIEHAVSGRRPSLGHIILAALTKLGKVERLWTTNFDRLLEDALVKAFGSTDSFAVASLDNPHLAHEVTVEQTRPLLVKLHGDFQSKRLKNTQRELQDQDAQLRDCLTKECANYGLSIVGYSGRDESVMRAIAGALSTYGNKAFPAGVFWFHRPGGHPIPPVKDLMSKLTDAGVAAHFVECDTFDELMQDVLTQVGSIPDDLEELLRAPRKRLTPVKIPPPGKKWPVIRLNALPVVSLPTVCRKVVCEIGGTKEVREAIKAAGVQVIGARRNVGVLAFGADSDVRSAFSPYQITDFDVHSLVPERFRFESAELGILNEAIVRALIRERPLQAIPTRQGWKVFVDPEPEDDPRLEKLRRIAGGMSGKVPGTDIAWREAIIAKLQQKLGRMWLVFEPSIWVDWPETDEGNPSDDRSSDEAVKEFVRERYARRYNRQLIDIFDAWVSAIVDPTEPRATLRALGIGDGIDAAFELLRTTGFSKRLS